MKFRAHGTFYLRKGWLHKGIKEIDKNPYIFWDKTISPMDEFGIGNNMVSSLRYWLQATGVVEEVFENRVRKMQLTPTGKIIWENDPYFEEDGTLYYIQYLLASNKELATSWYYFFNEFKMVDINKDDFVNALKIYIEESSNTLPAEKSLFDDFDCLIKTYVSLKDTVDPETNLISPLSNLELIKVTEKGNYRKSSPHKNSIHPLIILSVILQSKSVDWSTKQIKISSIENEPCNIGKVFNLSNVDISDYLDILQNEGYVKVVRTAGMDVVNIRTNMTALESLAKYYESII